MMSLKKSHGRKREKEKEKEKEKGKPLLFPGEKHARLERVKVCFGFVLFLKERASERERERASVD